VRSTATLVANVTVLRTLNEGFYRVFYKDYGATHLGKEMGNGQRFKLDATLFHKRPILKQRHTPFCF
jgi:hypothetical protein